MGPFRLNLYYSIASGIAVIAMAMLMASLYYVSEVGEHTGVAGARSEAVARSFSNAIWPDFGAALTRHVEGDPKALRDREVTRQILARLKLLSVGVPIIKVKIYNREGVAVFSSVLPEIGESKSQHPGFIASLKGNVVNNLTHRGEISATEGSIFNVDVVESYIPIHLSPGSPPVAVFEMYSDVTQTMESVEAATYKLLTGLIACFSILYGILILIVRRADKIIYRQYHALKANDDLLRAKNQALTDEINERLQVEKALRDSEQRAAAANRAKSEFLSMMSHELRTPLNSIIGFSEVLGERMFGELNAKQAEYVADIYSSGKDLLSLINDVLDLSKIEAGRMELDVAQFDLPSVFQSAVSSIRERAQRSNISLSLAVDPALGIFSGDERKVKQVLLNLLSNAVKFTGSGGRVAVTAEPLGDGVQVTVADNGVGIAPEDQQKVFEEFSQVGRDYLRKSEGTGLGLALAQSFVKLHGGTMKLESTPGVGSVFSFTLMPQTDRQEAP